MAMPANQRRHPWRTGGRDLWEIHARRVQRQILELQQVEEDPMAISGQAHEDPSQP